MSLDPYLNSTQADENAGQINGFPAAHSGVPGKGTKLACSTTIDTRRHMTFTVTVYTPHDACAASDTIASLAIDTAR